jgi:recombination protein RecT
MAEDKLVIVHNNLQKLLKDKAAAMPKNFNQTRFLQNCMTVLQDVKDIQKMDTKSVARTMLKGAFLGLDFFNKECYAIPYGNQLNFQTDYKGEIKLAKKYSLNQIHDIYAKLVREGDVFTEEINKGIQSITFKPKQFNNGKILGAFAVCLYSNGSMIYETMSVEEIEKVRRHYSKVPDGKAWKESFGEMCKKTVLRRLCKLIEIEFETIEQQEVYKDSSDFDVVDEIPEPIAMPKAIDEPIIQETEEEKEVKAKQAELDEIL